MSSEFNIVEADIAGIRRALDAGRVTSVELVAAYLNRIAFYDRSGIRLNAVPVLNPEMFAEALAADERRAAGRPLGPLDGIPYTAKDSYKARGRAVASGSPAFEHLVPGTIAGLTVDAQSVQAYYTGALARATAMTVTAVLDGADSVITAARGDAA